MDNKPSKAYENIEFLNSGNARTLRLLSEYLEPASRFQNYNIKDTIVFFGSARLMSRKDALKEYNKIKSTDPKTIPNFAEQLRKAQNHMEMSKYYEAAVDLSKRLTKWSMSLGFEENRFTICTGGGPGIMEAANKGAKLAGGYSVGLNISIPFEQFVNKYVTPQLQFEFHYFFMRKFWFAYLAKALVIMPGGFGTLDELMEILTLVQTNKLRKKITIVMYGSEYWKQIIDFEALYRNRMISERDLGLYKFIDTPEEAFTYLKESLTKNYIN